jgi:hypothetical protein
MAIRKCKHCNNEFEFISKCGGTIRQYCGVVCRKAAQKIKSRKFYEEVTLKRIKENGRAKVKVDFDYLTPEQINQLIVKIKTNNLFVDLKDISDIISAYQTIYKKTHHKETSSFGVEIKDMWLKINEYYDRN